MNAVTVFEVTAPFSGAIVLGALALVSKVAPHLPHHHDGYVSMNGHIWNCSACGVPPKNLGLQLEQAKAYCAEHPWCMYVGPDAEWRKSPAK